MPKYLAFLRAINVGGRVVRMEALRAIFGDLGFSNVETFIASGNVLFESRSKNAAALEAKIEKRLEAELSYRVDTFLRTGEEIRRISAYQPFPPAAREAAKTLAIGFAAHALRPAEIEAVTALRTEADDFHVNGREIYWLCRDGLGQSKLSNGALERAAQTAVTFRSSTTVGKLAAKFAGSSALAPTP